MQLQKNECKQQRRIVLMQHGRRVLTASRTSAAFLWPSKEASLRSSSASRSSSSCIFISQCAFILTTPEVSKTFDTTIAEGAFGLTKYTNAVLNFPICGCCCINIACVRLGSCKVYMQTFYVNSQLYPVRLRWQLQART